MWRKVDIIAAQFVMARSFGHLISSKCHAVSRVLTEAGFPVAVAAMAVSGALSSSSEQQQQWSLGEEGAAGTSAAKGATKKLSSLAAAAAGSISLGACSRILLAVVLSAAAVKALAHGLHVREHARLRREQQRGLQSFWSVVDGDDETEEGGEPLRRRSLALLLPPAPLPASPRPFFPHAATAQDRQRLGRAALSIAVGLLFFPLPEFVPKLYFLFHSLWHLAMARGIHSLYCLLEGEPEPEPATAVARAAAAGAAEAAEALRRLLLPLASSSSSSSSSSLAAAARRRRAAASRQHLQQQGAAAGAAGGGGHRRVLSVVFEGVEEEEEDEQGNSSPSSSSLSSLGIDGEEERAAAAAEASSSTATSDAARASTFLALSTSKAARFSPRTTTAAGEAGAGTGAEASCFGDKEGQERRSFSSALDDGASCCPSSASSSSSSSSSYALLAAYLGSLSSLFQAWASGGAPTTLSGILHASSKRGRGRLAAGRRRASGLLAAVAASLLTSSSSS